MSTEDEPARTGFWKWWMEQGRGGLGDEQVAGLCAALDPEDVGLCDRQVRRVRLGELKDARKYWLLCQITGLTLEDFLEPEWLERARERLEGMAGELESLRR